MEFASPFEIPHDNSRPFTSNEACSRQGTGNSGSSEEGNNIIPGGDFEGFASASNQNEVLTTHASNLEATADFPQTPLYNASFSGLGHASDFAFTPHHVPSQRSISSSIRSIDERTRRMNMASSPISCTPSKASPLASHSMQPSAFHMMGMPMTPSQPHTSFPTNANDSNARPVLFSQPVVNFSQGPPLQNYPSNALSSSLDQPRMVMASPRELHFPSPTALASSGSTDGSLFSTSSTAGFPGTPAQMRFGPVYGNLVATDGNKDVSSGHQYPATPNQSHPPSSVGSSYFQRQYHPYRVPHSEPVHRVAPSVFAFQAPREKEIPVAQDVFGSGNARHQHTKSPQFAIPCSPARVAPPTRPLPIHSMSLPNRTVLESPVSPEGRSFLSESEDMEDDGFSMSRRPSGAQAGGEFIQYPRSPKKHVW